MRRSTRTRQCTAPLQNKMNIQKVEEHLKYILILLLTLSFPCFIFATSEQSIKGRQLFASEHTKRRYSKRSVTRVQRTAHLLGSFIVSKITTSASFSNLSSDMSKASSTCSSEKESIFGRYETTAHVDTNKCTLEMLPRRRSKAVSKRRALRQLRIKFGAIIRKYRTKAAMRVIKITLQEWFTEGPHYRVVRFAFRRVRRCSLVIQNAWKRFLIVMKARKAVLLQVIQKIELIYYSSLWRLQEELVSERFERQIDHETKTPWIREHRRTWNATHRRVTNYFLDHREAFSLKTSQQSQHYTFQSEFLPELLPSIQNAYTCCQQSRTSRGHKSTTFDNKRGSSLYENSLLKNKDDTCPSKSLYISERQRHEVVNSIMDHKWAAYKRNQWAKRDILDSITIAGCVTVSCSTFQHFTKNFTFLSFVRNVRLGLKNGESRTPEN